LCLAACDAGAPSVEDGVAAYRAGEDARAWEVLAPRAAAGDPRARRYLARMLVDGRAPVECAPAACGAEASRLLLLAARDGDTNALILLEEMRAEARPGAPSEADIVAVERARAEAGDPHMAWRLARRYQAGEGAPTALAGDPTADAEYIRWLTIAARRSGRDHPVRAKAAFALCEAHSADERRVAEAIRWCKRAAARGHAGAQLALARLRAREGDAN